MPSGRGTPRKVRRKMGIRQWIVQVDMGRRMRFEREDQAIGAAFDVATPVTPGIVFFPDGKEYIVLQRDPRWTITINKVV